MLFDLLHYLTTPAPAALRRLGYVRESVRLMSRSRRCRPAWAPHLAAARNTVIDAFADLTRRRVAGVLGSGLLDDVPFANWPPPSARSGWWTPCIPGQPGTGSRTWPTSISSRPTSPARLSDPLPELCSGPEVDFVVSANLLSQLPILPLDCLEARGREAMPDLGRRIVAAHLRGLTGLTARVCLVTDTTEEERDREGRIVERLDLMHGLALPPPDRDWDWEFAPFGEAARDRRIVHRVGAYRD